jgi:hypothetical protein
MPWPTRSCWACCTWRAERVLPDRWGSGETRRVTQPDYVPLQAPDRVRPSDRLSTPDAWVADRPADLVDMRLPEGHKFGSSGPDQGYGLKLAKRFEERIVVVEGEERHDAVAGCFACGTRRSAQFGRAPVIYDMEWAYTLWGYLGAAAAELVAWRAGLFRGASHHYWDQRTIVDTVADATFALSPAQVAEKVAGADWAGLFQRR